MSGVFNRDVFNPNVFNTGALTSGDVSLVTKKKLREEVTIHAYNPPIYTNGEILLNTPIRKPVPLEILIRQEIIKHLSFEILPRIPIRKHSSLEIIPIKKVLGEINLTMPINPLEKTELYKAMKMVMDSEDEFNIVSDAEKVVSTHTIRLLK